ncbi:hypothetical protein [Saccharospirillum salsuginis]|uniref:Uncharacterized protein n=1 Tax=Saccharospirillum salsuginis TaxID=418750 RepID=A0A918KL73_9GAMM|nr:hypothetical protein [Saccharospirillum salsuginis]GGX65131.1 hypothetical protein GCM10007392_36250 [Saccharospirillum salsuginis]
MTEAKALIQAEEQKIQEQIQQYEAALAELKKAKETALKKEEGFSLYFSYLETLEKEYGITEEDIFSRRSVQIGDWVTNTLPRFRNSALMKRLEKFIGDRLKQQERKTVGVGRGQPAKDLPPGTYRHPMSLEKIQKKTRAPKELNNWVIENGLEKVRSWRIEED